MLDDHGSQSRINPNRQPKTALYKLTGIVLHACEQGLRLAWTVPLGQRLQMQEMDTPQHISGGDPGAIIAQGKDAVSEPTPQQ